MALDKPIKDIRKADLDALIANQVPEDATIEYKEALSLEKPVEKKEFLRDITAFANTRGGDIVVGVKEDRNSGLPQELCGMPLANPDQWKQLLENVARDGAAPRIYGIQFGDVITLGNGRFAIVIRIARSFNAPHMVVCGGDCRFYYRTNTGRERLDVTGLRTLFQMGDTVAARAHAFRAERLAKIIAGDTPVPLANGPKCVLHLVPFDAFSFQVRCNLSEFADHPELLAKAGRWRAPSGFERTRYNLDGVVGYVPKYKKTEPTEWYTQCFRNGIVEAVNMEHCSGRPGESRGSIGCEYEGYLSKAVREYIVIQRALGVGPPVCALVTLLDVKGRMLSVRDPRSPSIVEYLPGAEAFQEEHLILPDVVIEDFECDVVKQMNPIFEIVFNAAGLSKGATS